MTAAKPIKVKGRKVFVDGKHVATIIGYRDRDGQGRVYADYGVRFEDGRPDVTGYSYFADVVKHMPALLAG
jgi:hypothetical protein